MGVIPPWSFSSLTAFETCPRRYYLTRVVKAVVEPPTDATVWGNRVHQALEDRAKHGAPLPPEIAMYEPYVAKIAALDGTLLVEQRLVIDRSFNPSSWEADNAWCRGIVDIGVIGDTRGYLLDWKTGKRKPMLDQLKLFAAMAFAHYPQLERVVTGFIWLKVGKLDKETYDRSQLPEIWNEFLPRIKRVELAYEKNKWPAKPSGLCKNWCPVGRSSCEFCGC